MADRNFNYYVFLMPSGRLIVKGSSAHISADEADALDCWAVEARTMQQAIDKIVLRLYSRGVVKE